MNALSEGVMEIFKRLQEQHRMHSLEKSMVKAASQGDTVSVLAALDAGAAIESGAGGWTALMMAATEGHNATVGALLKRGANVNASDDEHEITSLMQVAASGDLQMVQMLLNAGVEVNSWDWEGRSAVDYAAREGHQDIITLLHSSGGEIGPINEEYAVESDSSIESS